MNRTILFSVFLFFVLINSGAFAQAASKNYSYKLFPAKNQTFGYDILQNGKPVIHQATIPGKPGDLGFSTRAQAEKVAKFVIYKMSKNIFPPTVTTAELDSLTKTKK